MTPLNKCGCGRTPYFVSNRMNTAVDSRISICLPPSGIAETKFAACCDCGIQTNWFDSEFHASAIWNRAFPAKKTLCENYESGSDRTGRCKHCGNLKFTHLARKHINEVESECVHKWRERDQGWNWKKCVKCGGVFGAYSWGNQPKPELIPREIVDMIEEAHKNTGDSKMRFKDNNGQ